MRRRIKVIAVGIVILVLSFNFIAFTIMLPEIFPYFELLGYDVDARDYRAELEFYYYTNVPAHVFLIDPMGRMLSYSWVEPVEQRFVPAPREWFLKRYRGMIDMSRYNLVSPRGGNYRMVVVDEVRTVFLPRPIDPLIYISGR